MVKTKKRQPDQIVEIIPKVYEAYMQYRKLVRHFIIKGGRGKGASWSIARLILMEGMQQEVFIVCTREVQKTIEHSVKKILEDTIKHFGWQYFWTIKNSEIVGNNGSKIVFYGLKETNADNIKSLEGADICWVAESQSISRRSIDILRPTVRKENAIFFWDYNPRFESDPVHMDYYINKDPNAYVLELTYQDNPWFTKAMELERQADKLRDYERYKHIWLGELDTQGEKLVCPASIVNMAMQNVLPTEPGITWVGADIAHQGGDEITFYKRSKNKIIAHEIYKGLTTPETVRLLKKFGGRTSIYNIDNGHVGASVSDYMIEDGYTVNRINFGGTPLDKEHYEDVATEMYFNLKEVLEYSDIPLDHETLLQLSCRRYDYVNSRRGYEVMKIENKKSLMEHARFQSKSPDRGDGIALCFYDPKASFNLQGIASQMSAYNEY